MTDFNFEEWQKQEKVRRQQEKISAIEQGKLSIANFKKKAKKHDKHLTLEHFDYTPAIGVIAQTNNALSIANINIKTDKDGLTSWKALIQEYTKNKFNSGYLYANDHIAMASHYFRRNFNSKSNWAPHFIDLFWSDSFTDIDAYIALDFDQVRLNIDNSIYIEHDTWFGAPFNEAIEGIPDGTTFLSPPLDISENDINFFFKDAFSLCINWKTTDNIKTFQALEFKQENFTITLDQEIYHPVRYIHAEYDCNKMAFRHFDGAIQLMKKSEYLIKRSETFNKNKNTKPKYQKLFKLNGKVTVKKWIEYSSHFFAGNPLLHEYFSGEYPENIKLYLEQRAKKNLP